MAAGPAGGAYRPLPDPLAGFKESYLLREGREKEGKRRGREGKGRVAEREGREERGGETEGRGKGTCPPPRKKILAPPM